MADTARTKTALAALFADNTSQQISPQDLRDFLETMSPSFGGYYFSTPAATTCTDASTFYKAAGTTTETNSNRVTVATTNRLTYTGTPTIHVHIAASVSFTTSGTNDVIAVALAKNGTVITGSDMQQYIGAGADIGSTALHFDAMLSTNEYLELWVANNTVGGTTVTIENGYVFFLGMMV